MSNRRENEELENDCWGNLNGVLGLVANQTVMFRNWGKKCKSTERFKLTCLNLSPVHSASVKTEFYLSIARLTVLSNPAHDDRKAICHILYNKNHKVFKVKYFLHLQVQLVLRCNLEKIPRQFQIRQWWYVVSYHVDMKMFYNLRYSVIKW